MPFDETHPIMLTPKTNITLWRYMDVPSFISLLLDESLTFIRADLFEDKFEGKIPTETAKIINESIRKKIEEEKIQTTFRNISELMNSHTFSTYLSCWIQEKHEIVHMWKIYSKEHGVAIETDYDTLKSSILSEESILPSLIKYIDFDSELFDWKSNQLSFFIRKKQEYKSENEFRLILIYPKILMNEAQKNASNPDLILPYYNSLCLKNPVIKIKVDINKLIKKIHLSPYAPKWYLPLIQDLVKKYNLNISEITQSEL